MGESNHSSLAGLRRGSTKRRRDRATAEKQRHSSGKFEKENKYRFKPGISGNPAGRPKHKTLGEAIRAFLEQPIDKRSGSPTLAEAIANAILKKPARAT